MQLRTRLIAVAFFIAAGWLATAAAQDASPIRVTIHNFARAETDNYFANLVQDGAFAKFKHERELASIDRQTVIRLNRDTLYSMVVLDLDAATATITLPDAGKRFLAMQVINEDHYTLDVIYKPGRHTFTREVVGTRYVMMLVRILVNPNDTDDVQTVHALQDRLKVEQNDSGKFEIPTWDQPSLKKMRDALNAVVVANGGLDSPRMFGRKDQVDPIDHLLGTAAGWGGNPRGTALYIGVEPKQNDGRTAYTLTMKDIPVDGFWSVSVYNKDGFFDKNAKNAYTFNNLTAKPNPDGSVTIHFGGDEHATNYLPIMPGWNYLIRMYRPRQEVLDGTWKAPEAQTVQ
jgi:hypothetical protein